LKFSNYEESLRLSKQIIKNYKEKEIIDIPTGYYEINEWSKKCHFFKVNNEIAFLLNVTDNYEKKIRMPFEHIFIDVNLKYEYEDYSIIIYGLHIYQPFNSNSDKIGFPPTLNYEGYEFSFDGGVIVSKDMLNKTFKSELGIDLESESYKQIEKRNECAAVIEAIILIHYNKENLDIPVGCITSYPSWVEKVVNKDELLYGNFNRQIGDDLTSWISNFNDFLNDPEVEYVQVKSKPIKYNSNKPRKKDKIKMKIVLKNKLKRYIQDLHNKRAFSINHKFWVRGHWRKYRHPRYKNMLGKKQWILPYVKGKGLLIEKAYELKNK